MHGLEDSAEGSRQAFVISPAKATAVAPYLAPGARVFFIDRAEDAVDLSFETTGCIAFRGAEALVALLQRGDLEITKVIAADDSAVAFFTDGGSTPSTFTSEEVVAMLKATSTDVQAIEPVRPAIPPYRDAETAALRREIANLREENRRHRARLTKIKRHPTGKLALRTIRMLRTIRK